MKPGRGKKSGRPASRGRAKPVERLDVPEPEEFDDDEAPRAATPAPLPGESITRRVDTGGADSLTLAGVNDANLIELQKTSGAKVGMRGDVLTLSGPAEAVERALSIAIRMVDQTRQQQALIPDDVLRFSLEGPSEPRDEGDGTGSVPSTAGPGGADFHFAFPGARKVIRPKTSGQTEYLRLIRENDIVVGIGPAGTGKTFLAVAAAVDALLRKRVRRIVLCRPAVEAGENLGFLPGDLQAKVDPYLRPLYDALDDMLPPERIEKAMETRVIEIAPLAFMRGRTLGDAFVILDEAQNATNAQMKMFLTRLGVNSKIVITGDKTQVDLPRKEDSGLFQVERILPGIEGIGFHYFNEADVVRHRLVRDIIKAYAHDAG